MGEIAKSFIENFHNLPGGTVKEKHQNLFNLLHQSISLKDQPEELEYIAAHLEPASHLEKILRADFLIYFKRFKELQADFNSGDEITVKKVSKQEWFFQIAYKKVGVEEFVDRILPATSHSLKLKILKKLPLNETQADEFFDAVHKRYGIHLATALIPKCSSNKITEILNAFSIKFSVAQLQILYEKDPHLVPVYFEERRKHEGSSTFSEYHPLFVFIAQKNPYLFSKLFNKYELKSALGRRTTKRYIASQKTEILNKPEAYLDILNRSVMIRKLGSEIKDIIFKDPSKRENSYYWQSVIKHYPKKHQFNIYRSAYDSVYHHKLADDIDNISEEVLEMMDDCEERTSFAMAKVEKEDNDDFLKYVKPDYCLKKFMEKVKYLKGAERARYVDITTYCCILNKDLGHLLKVCELVCIRFKNDEAAVRESLFRQLTRNMKLVDDFTEQHWKFIREIIATSTAKDEWVYNEQELRLGYLKHLIANNKPIKEVILKYHDWPDTLHYSNTAVKEAKLFRPIMMELLEHGYTKPDPDEELDVVRFDCSLADLCKAYNERNSKDVIEVYNHRRVLKSVKELLEKETSTYVDTSVKSGVEYVVCRSNSTEDFLELKKLYFKAFKTLGCLSGLWWFLKHEPHTLQDNFDQFLGSFCDIRGGNPRRLWRFVKKYSYLGLDRRTVEFCKIKLDEEGYKHKEKLVRPLTMLSSPDSHLEYLQQYAPISDKVDLTDDEVKELYHIQGKLMRLLHYLHDPAKVLPVAIDFCKGDYLQFALSPLYSSIYNLPENDTKLFIEKLDKTKALSVKKHALHLTCVIYDTDTVYSCLKNSTVPSLVDTLKYFVKNSSVALWDLIEEQITTLQKKDLQAIKLALNVTVPFKYKSRFVEIVWNVLDKYENKELKKIVLKNIDDDTVENFHPEFALKIIESSIFKLEEANDFVANLLIHSKTDEKYSVLSKTLSNFKDTWNDKETRRNSRQKLTKLVLSIFRKYIQSKDPKPEFVSELSSLFKSVFSPTEAFQESVLISCMRFKGETPENSAKVLIDLNNSFNKSYGGYMVDLFGRTVSKLVLSEVFTSDYEKIKLCHSLLKLKESVNDYLLILKFLPKKEPADAEHFNLYIDIVTELEQVSEDVVQLQFNLYLKSDSPPA